MRKGVRTLGNPFVAFTDLAIAMAFIFAICTIALSKSLDDITRDGKQESAIKLAKDSVKKTFGESLVDDKPIQHLKKEYDKRRNFVVSVRSSPKAPLRQHLKIQSDGSYLRFSFVDAFKFGSLAPTDEAKRSFEAFAHFLRTTLATQTGSYLYFHGIAEWGEAESYAAASNTLLPRDEFAALRAEEIYKIFLKEKVIAKDQKSAFSDGKPVSMDPTFAIAYGKSSLYAMADPPNSGRQAGRVDILIFFTDGT